MSSKLTRDESVPPEIAALVSTWSNVAAHSDIDHVVQAALNMLAWAIHSKAKASGWGLGQTLGVADRVGAQISQSVAEQWDRARQPGDISVSEKGN